MSDHTTPEALALPLRVLVKGASTVNWISGMGGPRSDLAFPRVIQDELHAAGRPCDVRALTMPSEPTAGILGTWQQEVLGYSPDVIVLVYGHYEAIHLFLPRWLERHANSLRGRPRPVALAYRRKVLRPVWMFLARLQAAVDSRIDPTVRRGRPLRVAADLRTYVEHVRRVGSPLVMIFELLPPARRYVSWFPGMSRRIEAMNDAIATMVQDLADDEVRYVRIASLVEEHADGDIDVATPDGFHYSVAMHRHVGRHLAGQILGWASGQPHLDRVRDRP